ncbi:TIGR04219 family outer membrane beta-barrel protein [Marinobacter vinifirmus]|uniref:TIGR04219 family outer membrane beta-barrel protein n=1 Tax=Marinobacter vinifirmus TaxID=355591 RepID=A0A558BDN3_9GAMM|nr:TIGR04219 family outer membrane beta-barrel protein [Marinobacter vinifirmus]TVT34611.1 MAG: TIGR04219 family outer membrane beta-barrel protein [Marinobacter vinifirmus]
MRKLMMAMGASMMVAAPVVSADILGVGATVGYWDTDYSGEASKGNDRVDLERDLNLSNDSNANLTAYFEHPVPVLPNVRLAYTRTKQSGNGQLNTGYDGVSGAVRSELELEQLDVTLYYEILDNWVNLDLGLTVRDFSGELLVQNRNDTSQFSETKADAVLPLVYVAARFDLPFTGVSVGGDANAISYDGDSVYDFNVYGQYEMSLLQLRAGYRQISLDYDDGDDNLDIELSGPFVSAGLRF